MQAPVVVMSMSSPHTPLYSSFELGLAPTYSNRALQTPRVVNGKRGEKPSCPTLLLRKREHPRARLQGKEHATDSHSVADIIRSCLGPKAMLKMLLDPMGGIVLTNDGHAILREIEVSHPAAKSMIELSRTQDEEVGDGTTTVIILGRRPGRGRSSPLGAANVSLSWRDTGPSAASAGAEHPPGRHHCGFQAGPEGRPRDH